MRKPSHLTVYHSILRMQHEPDAGFAVRARAPSRGTLRIPHGFKPRGRAEYLTVPQGLRQ